MKVAICTLGCKVNQYESQALAERFAALGFDVVDAEEEADVYVVNSCTVTGVADKKSRNCARRTKRLNPNALTALVGCYAEVAADELAAEVPEIDLLVGSAEKDRLPDLVAQRLGIRAAYEEAAAVTGLGGRTRAYIKVEDGCDRYCAFCIVPYARGPVRSRPLDQIVEEARALVARGYKELILTGVNAALYGNDLNEAAGAAPAGDSNEIFDMWMSRGDHIDAFPHPGILDVVDAIAALDGDYRIRLSSLEPTVIDADYARELVKRDVLCPHLHLPLQSGSDAVLAAMGRRYRMDDYRRIVDVLKTYDSLYSITTDLIVGFPGETEEDFEATLRAVHEIGFARLHVFRYSARGGTPAAEMEGQIPDETKTERSQRLISEGEKCRQAFLRRNAGTRRQALFFGPSPGGTGDARETPTYEGITDNDIEVAIASDKDLTGRLQYIDL
jgi:threonylcarbamoyladenosine tRNA methylthiotransferase MtaB